MTCREIWPCRRIAGRIGVPGDKSISHRAVILGGLADGDTVVDNFLDSADCRATVEIFRLLGCRIEKNGARLTVHGRGIDALREPDDVLQAGNSGTTMRLMLGVLAGLDLYAVITGDASLRRRPMDRVTEPLTGRGASFWGRSDRMMAPVAVRGRRGLAPLEYASPVASAQVKTALLLSGVSAAGPTIITEPFSSRDHGERMLSAFGARISRDGRKISLYPDQGLHGMNLTVPGDISSAAFFLVLAAACPGTVLTVEGVGINSTRDGIIDVLSRMGAVVDIDGRREVGGEPVADVTVKASTLKGVNIEAPLIPRLIDEIPALAVAAAVAEGRTVITGASELRVKESDRIEATCRMLTAFGAAVEALDDGMIISGGAGLQGAEIDSRGDHRVAMAASVAALLADGPSRISGTDCVDTSFPGFFDLLNEVTGNDGHE